MEEMVTETLSEGTTPNTEASHETVDTETPEAAPQATEGAEESSEQNTDADNEQNGAEAVDEDFLTVNINHETRTLNRDETLKYTQLGLQKEYLDPLIAKIDYLAAVKGVSREEFIEGQLSALDESIRQDVIASYGNDEKIVNDMVEFTKQKHQKAYDDMLARQKQQETKAQEDTETRLAGEFAKLCEEFPELSEKGFKGLPKDVKQAGFKGENLFTAYLHYKHAEGKRIAEAAQNAEKQKKASTGSMGQPVGEGRSEEDQNYLKGLWHR